MKFRTSLKSCLLTAAVVLLSNGANADDILFITASASGGVPMGTNSSSVADIAAFNFMTSLGHTVTAVDDHDLEGDLPSGNYSSFDGVVLSSTNNSGKLRNNYSSLKSTAIGIMAWEYDYFNADNPTTGNSDQDIMMFDIPGLDDGDEEQFIDVQQSGTTPLTIELFGPAHDIKFGMSNGLVPILNGLGTTTSSRLQAANGLATGVTALARGNGIAKDSPNYGTGDPNTHNYLLAVETGGALLAASEDGVANTVMLAPDRRVFFPLDNANFVDLTQYEGKQLFSNSLSWILGNTPVQLRNATVDRDTGSITLNNPTGQSELNIVGYSITSESGALDSNEFVPISGNFDAAGNGSVDTDDDWTLLTTPNSNGVSDYSEFQFTGASDDGSNMAAGAGVLLSSGTGAWLPTPDEDLSIEIMYSDGSSELLPIIYTGNAGSAFELGDIGGNNGNRPDGTIDVLDWNAFQDTYTSDLNGATDAWAYLNGDLDGDFLHTLEDFRIFKELYDAANGAGSFSTMVSGVPEPSAVTLLILVGLGSLFIRTRKVSMKLCRMLCIALLSVIFVMQATNVATADVVWGTHNQTNGSVQPTNSEAPGAFFSFDTSDVAGTLVDHGNLELDGVGIIVDGLAVKNSGLAVGFIVDQNSMSQMVWINGAAADGNASTPVPVNTIGSMQNYFATGAAYDASSTLWVVDNLTGTLHQINDSTGDSISSVALSNDGGNTVIYAPTTSGPIDIAFDSTGTGYLTQHDSTDALWTLDTSTGVLTEVNGDFTPNPGNGRQWVGLAFDSSDDDTLYGISMIGNDQVATYSISGGGTSTNVTSLRDVTGISGGRGDLATGNDSLIATEVITLQINTTTGQGVLKSTGIFGIDIDAYEITSASNSLDSASMTGLRGNPSYGDGTPDNGIGWEELASSDGLITEANLTGSSAFAVNGTASLGTIYPTTGSPQEDLVLSISLANGATFFGLVEYVDGAPEDADFDNDGDVDGSDFLAWQVGFGMNSGASLSQGDANGDGAVDATDFSIWSSQYGSVSGAGNLAGAAVPEPSTLILFILMTFAVALRKK